MECERALATSRPVIAINKTCTNVLTRLESYKRLVSVSSRSHLGLISVSSFYVSCPSLTGDTPKQLLSVCASSSFLYLCLLTDWLRLCPAYPSHREPSELVAKVSEASDPQNITADIALRRSSLAASLRITNGQSAESRRSPQQQQQARLSQ